MSNATTLSTQPPKRVLASGLFGAFVVSRPLPSANAGRAQNDDEFVDDFIAGTHAHPQRAVAPARK